MKNKQPYLYLFLGIVSLLGVNGITDSGMFGNYCGLLMRIWSLFHLCLIVIHGYLRGPIRYFTLFVMLLMLYSLIPAIQGETYTYTDSYGVSTTMSAFNYANVSWMFASPVFSFYWFTKRGFIDKNFIRFLTIVGVFYCILLFIQTNIIYAERAYSADSGHTNNSAYVFLHLFPLLFFFKDKVRLQYILLLIVFFAIIIGAKRGALLIAVVCLPLFLRENIKLAFKNKTSLIFFSIFALLLISMIMWYEYVNNSYFHDRMKSLFEGDSSQRDDYYSLLWTSYVTNFDIYEQLFGFGINGPLMIIGDYAHNDWLEYLISFGFIGFLVYGLYMISLFKFYFKNRRFNKELSSSFLITIIILFMSSLFSMSYTGMTIFITFSLAYTICNMESNTYSPNARRFRTKVQ